MVPAKFTFLSLFYVVFGCSQSRFYLNCSFVWLLFIYHFDDNIWALVKLVNQTLKASSLRFILKFVNVFCVSMIYFYINGMLLNIFFLFCVLTLRFRLNIVNVFYDSMVYYCVYGTFLKISPLFVFL